jgi:hypothetical protein
MKEIKLGPGMKARTITPEVLQKAGTVKAIEERGGRGFIKAVTAAAESHIGRPDSSPGGGAPSEPDSPFNPSLVASLLEKRF